MLESVLSTGADYHWIDPNTPEDLEWEIAKSRARAVNYANGNIFAKELIPK